MKLYLTLFALLPLTARAKSGKSGWGKRATPKKWSPVSPKDSFEVRCNKNKCESECREECENYAHSLAEGKEYWCSEKKGRFSWEEKKGTCGYVLVADDKINRGDDDEVDCKEYAKCVYDKHEVKYCKGKNCYKEEANEKYLKYKWALGQCQDRNYQDIKKGCKREYYGWEPCDCNYLLPDKAGSRRLKSGKKKDNKNGAKARVCEEYYDCWYDELFENALNSIQHENNLDRCMKEGWFETTCKDECKQSNDCPYKKSPELAYHWEELCNDKLTECCKKKDKKRIEDCMETANRMRYAVCCDLSANKCK